MWRGSIPPPPPPPSCVHLTEMLVPCSVPCLQVGNLKNVYHFLKPVHGFDKTKSIDGIPAQYYLTQQLKDEPNVQSLLVTSVYTCHNMLDHRWVTFSSRREGNCIKRKVIPSPMTPTGLTSGLW